jgi:hypothetical protein
MLTDGLPYTTQPLGHARPALRPVRVVWRHIPLGHRPSLPLLRRPAEGPCSQGSSVLCWCLTSPDHASPASVPTFPVRTLWTRRSVRRSPRSCARSVRACQGSQTAQSQTAARGSAPVHVAFHSPTGVGTLDEPLSRRDTPPTRAPTDFSSVPSRRPPHGLGPMWFATPSS